MSNVIVDKSKIDILANAISVKSGEPVTMTLDELVSAVDGIENNPAPTLETVTKTYTPSTSQQTDTITPSTGYDGIGEVDVTVSAVPLADVSAAYGNTGFITESNVLKWKLEASAYAEEQGWVDEGLIGKDTFKCNAVASNTSITPTESSQTVGGYQYMMQGAVTVNAIPSNYVGSGITQRTSSDLSASGATVTAPAGYYSSQATKTVASGTEGTPTATKGTVSNHSVSVTPSVTNSAGYISGGTHSGTAVTVTASELASGNKEITENGSNIDVVGYSTVSVNVSGGGGSSVAVETIQNSSLTTSTLTFTGLKGEPTSFSVFVDDNVSTSSPANIAAIVYDGTSVHTQTISTTSNAQVSYVSSGVTYTYNSGTLTITSATAQFVNAEHYLTYSYNGSASNVHTADVQVGSGATSITFTGLEDEPIAWSCIFKSNFSTSSGYQRVIATRYDGDLLEGIAMDSSAHPSTAYWSQSYSNGSLTITSQGTNAGGYFHQPGYYQLTYVIGEASPYEKVSKTYRASTTAQSEKIEPSTGYDAMSEVNVTIPAVTQTNLTAANIKSGTTISISNGSTNLWSVTGTYSGGGGSANIGTTTTDNNSATATSISFTSLSGTPKAFFVRLTSQVARSSSNRFYYVINVRYNGTNTQGNKFYQYNGTYSAVTSGYTYTYSNGTLTVSSNGSQSSGNGSFYNGTYELVYIY